MIEGIGKKGTKKVLRNEVKQVINSFDEVADFIRKNDGTLPDNYILKERAEELGWNPKLGNLAEVAPGKSIGGDIYHNYPDNITGEKMLPDASGRVWWEADIDYESGYRNAKRIYYSNDDLLYKTLDHETAFPLE